MDRLPFLLLFLNINKYAAGFVDCAAEINRYLKCPEIESLCASDLLGSNLKSLIIQHLELCTHEMTEELSERASVIGKELNNNISQYIERTADAHDNVVEEPLAIPQDEIITPLIGKHENAYFHFEDTFTHSSDHIPPSGSGDELIDVAKAHQLISENSLNMVNPFANLVKNDRIAAPSNYVDHMTSFPASIWPYLVTNQYGPTVQSEDFAYAAVNVENTNIFTLKDYIGAAVEGAINKKPTLKSNINKISDISKEIKSKRTLNKANKYQVEEVMPIDYSLKSNLFPNNKPQVIEYLDPLCPMWRPW